MQQRFRIALATPFFVFAAFSPQALAGDPEDIQQLAKARQYSQVIDRADQFLERAPKDALVRFLRALALTELNRTPEAIKAFSALTEDYPQLPEPYNNLAVIYAQQNQLDKARAALQMAIQTNPSYATAHENLGDLYARLASQSYDKALQLEGGQNVKTKLTLVRELYNRNATAVTVKPSAAPTRTEVVKIAPSKVPSVTATPVVTMVATATSKPVIATPTAKPQATKAPVIENNDRQLVVSAVQAWAEAWSHRQVDRYLAAYDQTGFKPPKGAKFADWAKERRDRIVSPKSIDVRLSDVRVEVQDATNAKVRFRQAYRSDRLSTTTSKTLILRKIAGHWLITEERAG